MKKIYYNSTKVRTRVGYCHNKIHTGYLSPDNLEEHKCLEKKCPYLQKYKANGFWDRKYIETVLKKLKKQYLKRGFKDKVERDVFLNECKKFYDNNYLNIQMDEEQILIDDFIEYYDKKLGEENETGNKR